MSRITKLFLNSHKLIVLADTIGTRQGTSLDLLRIETDRKISDGGILSFTRTVRNDGGISSTVSFFHSIHSLSQGSNLVNLDEDGVGYILHDSFVNTSLVGDK